MSQYSVCPEGGFWEAADRPKVEAAPLEMTAPELVVWTMRDMRDQWMTGRDVADMTPSLTAAYAARILATLYHAGVLDRELMEGTGRYRYRWLGAGPGGVR